MPFFNIRLPLESIVQEINENLYRYTVTDLFEANNAERNHQNRKSVILAINQAVRTISDLKMPDLDAEKLRRKARALRLAAKKKFVKRMIAKHGFFAMDEIVKRYPDYDEYQMERDLKTKPK